MNKFKLLFVVLFIIVLSGCGITKGSYDPKTGQLDFWMGKEYKRFVLVYKKGNDSIYIIADQVGAVESQKLIGEGLGEIVKGALKGAKP
jgi:hypothetical protein